MSLKRIQPVKRDSWGPSEERFGYGLGGVLLLITLAAAALILAGHGQLAGWGDAPRWLQALALVLGVWLLPALFVLGAWRGRRAR